MPLVLVTGQGLAVVSRMQAASWGTSTRTHGEHNQLEKLEAAKAA